MAATIENPVLSVASGHRTPASGSRSGRRDDWLVVGAGERRSTTVAMRGSLLIALGPIALLALPFVIAPTLVGVVIRLLRESGRGEPS